MRKPKEICKCGAPCTGCNPRNHNSKELRGVCDFCAVKDTIAYIDKRFGSAKKALEDHSFFELDMFFDHILEAIRETGFFFRLSALKEAQKKESEKLDRLKRKQREEKERRDHHVRTKVREAMTNRKPFTVDWNEKGEAKVSSTDRKK